MYCPSSALSSAAESSESYVCLCTILRRGGTVLFVQALLNDSRVPIRMKLNCEPKKNSIFISTLLSLPINKLMIFGTFNCQLNFSFISQYQIQTNRNNYMENQFRSPIKPINRSKSKSKLSKSVTLGKQSKYKQQSQSKNNAAYIKDISDRPPYKNLLNKLLRSQNLIKFVKQAQKYVQLSEELVSGLKSDNMQNERSRNQSYEYGRVLLRDGSFIRYYCKLVEKWFPQRKNQIRELFFQKYRNQISLRQKMFFDYFKEECFNQDSATFSFSKSKGKQKIHSKSVSQKKAKTEVGFPLKEHDKAIEILTTIDNHESSNSIETKDEKQATTAVENQIAKSEVKKRKIVHFQKQPVEEVVLEENYHSPFIPYKGKETEEERELRLSGIVKSSKLKSNEKRKSNIVKFQDELKSNQKLREIYQQILKQKQERQKQVQIQSNKKQSQTKPIVRKTMEKINVQVFETRIKEFTSEQKQKLSSAQKQIISHYPAINLKASKKGIQISAIRMQGHYKGYVIKKALMTDINHYLQPEYIGIIIQKSAPHATNMKQCQFQSDDRVVVVLFD